MCLPSAVDVKTEQSKATGRYQRREGLHPQISQRMTGFGKHQFRNKRRTAPEHLETFQIINSRQGNFELLTFCS